MNWVAFEAKDRLGGTGGVARVALVAALIVPLAVTANAQFQCPTPTPLAGESAGVDTTVTIAVTGEDAPPGGISNMTANVSGGDGNIASILFDVCFDPDVFTIGQVGSPAGPCRPMPPLCPGNQPCEGGRCIEQLVTACTLLGGLDATHTLKASIPEIPENPDDPVRIRLAVTDATRDRQQCSIDEDCPEGEICPFGTACVRLCDSDEDCAPNRCRDILVSTQGEEVEESVCTPLDRIPEGDLVRCRFDVLEQAPFGTTSLDFTDLIEAADDDIPEPNSLPVLGIGDTVEIFMCTNNDQCPAPKVCVDGRCLNPTPTPTRTTTATPTRTATPQTIVPTSTPTSTRTNTATAAPSTATPTLTLTPIRPTATPTLSPTPIQPTTPPTLTATPRGPTATATRTRTPTAPVGITGEDDDSCQIRPAAGNGELRGWLLSLAPVLIAWRRSRRRSITK